MSIFPAPRLWPWRERRAGARSKVQGLRGRSGVLALVLGALVWGQPAVAQLLLAPDDRSLRADLQYLADAGVLQSPLTTWPIPRAQLQPLLEADVEDYPSAVRAAHERVVRRVADPARAEVTVRAAARPDPRTYFGDVPTHEQELEAATRFGGDRWGGRAQANAHFENGEDDFHLDGSYAGFRVGNWLLHAGAVDRWWGPGSEGSLILTDNARPVPSIGVDRVSAQPFEVPILRWLGPWSLSGFFGQLDSDRSDAPNAKLFGMRLAFRPYSGLEIGLSRTAQWGGDGRPEDFDSFWYMLTGQSNFGDAGDDEPTGGHANQFAGWDLRWASPIGEAPYAIYMQLIGIDEAGNYLSWPYQNMGLAGVEGWFSGAEGRRYRWHLEAADTATNFWRSTGPGRSDRSYSNAYIHSFYQDGYRYHDRVQGHSMDSGGRMFSLGLQAAADGNYWEGLLRYTQQNRGGVPEHRRAPAVAEEADYLAVDLVRGISWGAVFLEVSVGAEHSAPATSDRSLDLRGWTRLRWELF